MYIHLKISFVTLTLPFEGFQKYIVIRIFVFLVSQQKYYFVTSCYCLSKCLTVLIMYITDIGYITYVLLASREDIGTIR